MKIKGFLSGYGLIIVAGIISVVTISAVTSLTINQMMKPKIVSVDIKKTTNDFVQQTAILGSKVSKQQLKVLTDKFNSSLNKSINEYETKGYIVIVSPAVVAGVPDITAKVQRDISNQMKGAGN